MQWNNVNVSHKFSDNSIVTQRHQTSMYDCYKLTYEINSEIKEIICSKDHLIKINIRNLPPDAQNDIKNCCVGLIALSENIELCFTFQTTDEQQSLVKQYLINEVDKTAFNSIEDLSNDTDEVYMIVFKDSSYNFVRVQRVAIKQEPQRIDDFNYWVPFEGINYLIKAYGEIEI